MSRIITPISGSVLVVVLSCFFSAHATTYAQQPFSHSYFNVDRMHGAIGQGLTTAPDLSFFATSSVNTTVSPRRFESSIVEVDRFGEVVNITLLEDAQGVVASAFWESMTQSADSLYVLSEYSVDGTPATRNLAITAYSKDNGGLHITRYPNEEEDLVVGRLLNFNSVTKEFRMISWPTSLPAREHRYTRFQVMDSTKTLVLDRSLETTEIYELLDIWDIEFFDNGDFLVAAEACLAGNVTDCASGDHPARIMKFTANGDHLWTRTYKRIDSSSGVVPQTSLLPNGDIAFAWTRDTTIFIVREHPPIIYILDSLGQMKDSMAFRGNQRRLYRLRTAANGDLLGVGQSWSELGYTGWAVRVTPAAELVWERYIEDNRGQENFVSDLTEVRETPDGYVQLLGTRTIREDPPDDTAAPFAPWLVQLTADGCFTPGCTNDTINLVDSSVSVTYVPEAEGLTLAPNPVVNVTRLTLPPTFTNRPLSYQLLSLDGREVGRSTFVGPATSINLAGLPAGTYLLRVFGEGGKWLAARKVVKQ